MKIKLHKVILKCRKFFSEIAEKAASACARRRYRIKITKFNKPKEESFLVIYNRATDFDKAFAEKSFGERMYDADNKKDGCSVALSLDDLSLADEAGALPLSRIALIRELDLPIALFRIEDGYSYVEEKKRRKGKHRSLRAGVAKVVYPKVFSAMSDAELSEVIYRELKTK